MRSIPRALAVAAAVLAVAGGLAACSSQSPYIYAPELIDRKDPNFGKPRTDRTNFTVCYAKWQSTAAEVRDLAVKECGLYGKHAVFVGTTYQTCPLLAPAGANYLCLAKGQSAADVDGKQVTSPSQAQPQQQPPARATQPAGTAAPATSPTWAPATESGQ